MKDQNKSLHWSQEKEVAQTILPLRFLMFLFKLFPGPFLRILAFPVSFFYFIFSSRARSEAVRYQKQFIVYTHGKYFRRPLPLRQILAFSLTLIEKIEGWAGKATLKNIHFQDDDIEELKKQLEEGKGALLLCSHMGNVELLRSLADFNRTGVSKPIQVTSIIDMGTTANFNNMIKKLNPRADMNIVNANTIGPETIIELIDEIKQGGLVVIAGDRTSANTTNRFLERDFLGKPAPFSYGVYLMAALINAPTYFVFAMRTKTVCVIPEISMSVIKSHINFNCTRKERIFKINDLCTEFVQNLQNYCIKYPFQWYNFYNFWAFPGKKE